MKVAIFAWSLSHSFYIFEHLITKTYLYNFDPLKPLFYIVQLVFTGVYIFFLCLHKNIDCGYSLESPWREMSDEDSLDTCSMALAFRCWGFLSALHILFSSSSSAPFMMRQ